MTWEQMVFRFSVDSTVREEIEAYILSYLRNHKGEGKIKGGKYGRVVYKLQESLQPVSTEEEI